MESCADSSSSLTRVRLRHPPHQRYDALIELCHTREHGPAHLHTLFRPKDRLPAHLNSKDRPTRVQARLLMDAQISCTYGLVSDLHSKDPGAF